MAGQFSLPQVRNLFEKGDLSALPSEELFEQLFQGDAFRLERISSYGNHTAQGKWYDQAADEWVALLRGQALLLFQQGDEVVELRLGTGDYVVIPTRLKHRVEEVSEDAVWLALHKSE